MRIAEYFEKGGPVEQARAEIVGTTEYETRKEQIHLAEMAAECFEAGGQDQGAPTHVVPVEGEPGTGKTLGSLIPIFHTIAEHIRRGETNIRAGYAAHTIALLRQAESKDVKIAQKAVKIATGVDISVARYSGAGQFVSLGALDSIDVFLSGKKSRGTPSTRSEKNDSVCAARIKKILQWHDDGESLLIVDLKEKLGIQEYEPLLPGYADSEIAGDYREVCEYEQYKQMRRDVSHAHFVLMSATAALLNGYRRFAMIENISPIRYLIVDEAHKIPDAAESIYNRSVSLNRLERVLRECGDIGLGDKAAQKQAHSAAEKAYNALFNVRPAPRADGKGDTERRILADASLDNGMPCRNYLNDKVKLKALTESTRRYAESIETRDLPVEDNVRSTVLALKTLADDLADVNVAINAGSRYRQVGGVIWSPIKGYPSLALTTLYPGRLFARYLKHYPSENAPEDAWAGHLWGAVIMSATLPDLRDIGLFDGRDQDGNVIEPTEAWQVPPKIHGEWRQPTRLAPEKRFGSMSFILSSGVAPKTMGAPHKSKSAGKDEDKQRYVDPFWEETHLVPMIAHVLDSMKPDENGVLLTPSFEDLDHIEALLPENRDYQERMIYQRRDAGLAQAVHEFRARATSQGRVLLLSTGGWEGIDLPGLVNHLIIARVPRPPRDELWGDAYLSAYPEKETADAEKILYRKQDSAAFNKLRQGLGRGIRQASDSCTVWIADKAFGIPHEMARMYDDDAIRAYEPRRNFVKTVSDRFRTKLIRAQFYDAKRGVFTPMTPATARQRRRQGALARRKMPATQQASF